MKAINKIIILGMAVALFNSCDLTLLPENAVTPENYFQNKSDLELWYAMALVDVLEFIPQHEAGRDSLLDILNNVAVQVKKLQDPKTGGWYQVMDRSGDKGNYVESSCSAMFIYSLFKAVRLGYIDKSYLDVALKGYKGFLDNFIEVDKNGLVTITKACAVAGLGGKVYRSGDYDYYINETIRNNDPKAVGPFIMASLEYERLQK